MIASGLAVSMNDYFKQQTARVDEWLDRLLPAESESPATIHQAMRYSIFAGGKRLRPILAIAAGAIFDAPERELLPAACALEMIHTYSLIHDDLPCMDDDDLRRGRPTLHRAFDEATALLAGDALLTLAFELLADPQTHAEPQMRTLLIAALARAAGAQGMVAGQVADMAGQEIGSDLIAVTRMNRLKTGALFSFSVEAGALIGCAADAERQALTRYAHDVGLAFQMVDDLLDAEGMVGETGKAVGKDEARGKANFVTVLGVDATRERVHMLAGQAKRHISMFGPRGAILADAVDFVVTRRR